MKLQDKVVLVTAATKGIGLACAKRCAEEGAQVYLTGRSRDLGKEEAAALREKGWRAQFLYHDAAKVETAAAVVEEVVAQSGRIDVLVNNFGTSDPTRDLDLLRTETEVFLHTVRVNLGSVFAASQAAARHMAAQGGGSIINISSVGGVVPDISQIAYGTSKAAINYLTKLIAVQGAKGGIRCNAVLPGMTATDAVKAHLSEEFRALFLRQTPLARLGLPEEMAAAVLYFASDASDYTTGQLLTVSGGFGLATPLYGALAGETMQR